MPRLHGGVCVLYAHAVTCAIVGFAHKLVDLLGSPVYLGQRGALQARGELRNLGGSLLCLRLLGGCSGLCGVAIGHLLTELDHFHLGGV